MACEHVFICAAGHSGSTLLDLILGAHSQVTSLGEVTQLPKNLALNTPCACGDSVRSCTFWNAVLRELESKLRLDLSKDPYALDLGFIDARVVVDKQHQSHLYNAWRRLVTGGAWLGWMYGMPGLAWAEERYMRAIQTNLALYDVVRNVAQRPVIVDSTKHYMKAVGLYKATPNRTRILFLTRDGRGVFYSHRKRGLPRKPSLMPWYRHFARALPLIRQNLPADAVMQVKYESLCGDPAGTLRQICTFIGIDYEPGMLDFSSHVHHVANGNDMRFLRSSEIRCDEKWRDQMDSRDLKYFVRHAWDLNRRLGYGD